MPDAIGASALESMLGASEGFCSWDAAIARKQELMDSWPYLFSQQPTQLASQTAQ